MYQSMTGNPSANMAQVMAKVRKMSDSQLADILSGKDVSVPQFAAMTEAMGRKQLRQAVDGAQAQQQAQQPSIKDQLLAEQAQSQGIAALPAPNMLPMGEGMAGGGIVAFANTGVVGDSKAKDEWEALQSYDPGAMTKGEGWGSDIANFFSRSFDSDRKIDPETGKPISFKEFLDKQERKNIVSAPAAPVAPVAPAAPVVADKKDDKAPAAAPAAAQPPAPSGKRDRLAMPESPDYLSPLTGVGERIRGGIADLKKAKESDALLGLSKALLGNATLAKAGSEASGTLMELGAKTRKEVQAAEHAADAYDFNMAKAREAAAQGNKELALKYQQLADLNAYHMGSLGIQGQKLGMMKDQYDMVKIPAQLSNIYAKATDAVKAATAMRPVKPAEFQKMVDEEYRKRATAVGLGKAVDLYSPSMGGYNVVNSLPKGAKTLSLNED